MRHVYVDISCGKKFCGKCVWLNIWNGACCIGLDGFANKLQTVNGKALRSQECLRRDLTQFIKVRNGMKLKAKDYANINHKRG